jgi:putative phosphoribosyl transferase
MYDQDLRDVNQLDLLPAWHFYRDRVDAGARLAERFTAYRGQDVLVLGIPRGGVPVAAELARNLDAELDVIVARKLGAPFQPELAIGAVTANGGRYLNKAMLRAADVTAEYLAAITAEEMAEARRREEHFRGKRPPPRVEGRTIIVVDDGLATGATMRAAVRAVRRRHPARVIVAVPVAPPATCASLRAETDEVVALLEPEPFHSVGLYYEDFTPPEEGEIELALRVRRQPPRAKGTATG